MIIKTEEHLERVIREIFKRKDAAKEGSAAYRMALRQLHGLRDSYEMAGPIMESVDPWTHGDL